MTGPAMPGVPASAVMHHGVIAAPPHTPLVDVASQMADNGVHCVVVEGLARSRGGQETLVWGILSDLDLMRAIAAGRTYHLKTYYRVLAPITTEWEAFIHIDGYHRRHNGDHKVMNGKYAMSLWLPGDLVMDDHEFKLEPNFTPGTYTVYFGLFVGDTRLKVKSGPNDGDNRINGGPLRVQ